MAYDPIAKLKEIIDLASPFAPTPGSDFEKNKKSMLQELVDIEKLSGNLDYEFHFYIGLAYRNFCAWYVRGDERIEYLEKIVFHLKESIELNADFVESKIELIRILIEESKVRDLDKALGIVSELKKANSVPDWMASIIEKAKRWKGDIDIPKDCNFKKLEPSPAVLREERTKLRKLLTEYQNTKNTTHSIIAMRLYNLALYVAYLYGSHHCNSGVNGSQFDQAVKISKKVCGNFNFNYLGKIIDAEFLSEADYKKIEKSLGNCPTTITIEQVKKLT